ncbi:T9SS type A sorting domain-containing protein [Adhaeribacter pallidiroseus]|uniref:Secretion system C-terminal sorting domain-containing protein n=1 Tax=Adhaeribacter pallidiroseus TaxID=2072847 RepID=A0A369QJH5_9BACT|nr:T9SS type A sorting domain-containing protein [Adhaeribacter pallidiroseus]RDC64874.1 hypothetical protein AHMF7616_03496 [Adhaeribacter pallidiroseus]
MKTTFSIGNAHFLFFYPTCWEQGFLLLAGLLVSFSSLAQTKLWDKTLIGGNSFVVVHQTSDNGYILGGNSSEGIGHDKTEANRGEVDYWVVKLNADGTKAWDKTFGGNSSDNLTNLLQTPDGGYILGGYSNSGKSGDKTEANKGGANVYGEITNDYWLLKINANGTKQWDKTFGGNNHDYLKALQLTSDGGYILGGVSRSGKSGDKSEVNVGPKDEYGDYSFDCWIIKIDATGKKVWDKTLGEKRDDGLVNLEVAPDGGFLLSGFIGNNFKIFKIAEDGTKTSENKISVNNIRSFQTTTDGGFIVSYSPVSTWNFGLVKFKADGTKEWNKIFGGKDVDRLETLQQTHDGGFILGSTSNSGLGNDKTEASKGFDDYWVVKLSANGTKVWDRTFGGNGGEWLQSLQQTRDEGYILGGTSGSDKSGDKSEEGRGFWIVKLDNKIRQNQNITFEPILLNKAVGDAPFALVAQASSGLPVNFKILSGPATVSGNMVTLTGVGTVKIQAYQAGNATYNFAEVTHSFVVEEKKIVKTEWDKTLGGFNLDHLTAMVATPDGGYLVGGYSVSGKTGDKSENNKGTPNQPGYYLADYWVVKLNHQGAKLWDKAYGGTEADKLTTIIVTPDGGYLLGGTSASSQSGDKSQEGKGKTDFWLVKLDATGQKIWDQTYGGSEADNLSTLLATPDGGYLLGGSSESGKSGDKSQVSKGNSDYWLIKIDAQGTKIWDKTYGGSEADKLNAIVVSANGGYLIGGSSASGKSGDKSQESRGIEDYWILCLQEDGTKLWDKTYGGLKETYYPEDCTADPPDQCLHDAGSSILTTLLTTPDGGYLLGGYSSAEKGAEKSDNNLNVIYDAGLSDYWVVKIDSMGTKVWDKTYGGINTEINFFVFTGNSELKNIIPTPDGNYLLAGTSNSKKGGEKSEDNRGGAIIEYPLGEGSYRIYTLGAEDYWLVKIDGEGTQKWDKTIGSLDYDGLAAVVPVTNGDYVIAGTSAAYGIGGDKTAASQDTNFIYHYKEDYWVVKVKEDTPVQSAWNRRYGGSGTDNLTSTIKTQDGGYLSGGYTNSGISGDKSQNSQGKNDYWLVKSDKNGKKLWDKRYGGSGDDYLNRVIQTADGGYLLAGSSFSGKSGDKSQASKGNLDYWLVKTDQLGNKEWDKTYGGSGEEELVKVIQLRTGEYVLGGFSNSPVSGDKTQAAQGGRDYWLVKISKNGTILWDQRYGGSMEEMLGSFIETPDGGYLLGGSSLSGKNGDKTQSSQGVSDYWVVKTDKQGTLVWEKTLGGNQQDEGYSVGMNSAKNYFISGTSSSGKSGDKSQESKGGKDYWLVTLDQNGNKLWERTFGGSKDDELRASTFTSQGHYVLAGHSSSEVSGDKTQASQGESDYWIVEVDQQGNQVQDLRYGGSGTEELRTVTQTKDGGLLLGGRSNSGVSGDRTQPSQGSTDYWLVKVAPQTSPMVAERTATLAQEPATPTEFPAIKAYPNPFQNQVSISFTLPETQPTTIKIYDLQGREVATLFKQEAKAHYFYSLKWQASNKTAGMYFLQLQTPDKHYQVKLLLTK